MSLDGLHIGQYGVTVTITLNDIDTDTAADISSYTTLTVDLKSPSGTVTTKTASFVTDGSDGQVQFDLESGDLDETGRWKIQVNLISGSSEILSEIAGFSVADAL